MATFILRGTQTFRMVVREEVVLTVKARTVSEAIRKAVKRGDRAGWNETAVEAYEVTDGPVFNVA